MRFVIIILGPTASGKSALGVRLAKKFHGIVVSADSRQVYRGLDIGTAKITAKEMRGVPHYLLDVASPRGQYSVDRYVKDVRRVLKTLPIMTPIFLVGGSPYYIDALTKPNAYSTVPPNPLLRRRLATQSTNQLINQLTRLDPVRVKTIDRANRRRLIRAIEIAIAPEAIQVPRIEFEILKIGISIPQEQLHARIDRRVDARMSNMITEVRKLHRQGLSWKRLDAFGLEYRFVSLFLRRKITRPEMAAQLKTSIHHFAKRQMTWWKRDSEIHWVSSPNASWRLATKLLNS